MARGAPSVATARRAARLRKDTGGTRVGACCDDAVHSRQGAHHGSCQTAACVNCKATCMRPVHACTCMRPRTLGLVHYIHTREVYVRPAVSELCGVCAHVYGRGYVHVFFSCVHRTRPLTRVYVHRLPSPTEGQLGLVGMHDRAREVHAHLPRKSCTRRMCAFATACTRDEGTKKTEDATDRD